MTNNGFLGVVQFIHPGNEHKVDKSGWTPWNLGMHARKYMAAESRYVLQDGSIEYGESLFWGEWEGPSRRIFSWEPSGELPKNLVIPHFPGHPRAVAGLQNTDPYVFGDGFRYTLCKQVKRNGQSTFLANLLPGTLVLFGSKLGGRFVLDTAFVVADPVIRHSRQTWREETADVSDTYKAMALEPMYFDPNTIDGVDYSLYTGAADTRPHNDMYSFFPSIPVTNVPLPFARPTITLEGVVNPKLMMGQRRTQMSGSEIKACWDSVVRQVHEAGLNLGVFAAEPGLSSVSDHLWPH